MTTPNPSILDVALGPDPGVQRFPADLRYRRITSKRALALAERNHRRQLQARYRRSTDWADYSVRDLRLPWTNRQRFAVALVFLVGLVGVVIGDITNETPLLAGSLSIALSTLPGIARDVWRLTALWLANGP